MRKLSPQIKEGWACYRNTPDERAALNDAIARRFSAFYLFELLAAKREASNVTA
jgi:hypothetical protein